MDSARKKFREALASSQYDLQGLSLLASKNRTYLHKWLTRETPRYLPVDIAMLVCTRVGGGLDWREYVDPKARAAVQTISTRFGEGPGTVAVAELDVEAAAGAGAIGGQDDPILWHWSLPRPLMETLKVPEDAARILQVTGDSMEPAIGDGDHVMVDTSRRRPSPPGLFVVWDGFGLVVKRVQHVAGTPRLLLTSDNTAYGPYEREIEEAHIQGRVVWVASSP